MRYMTSQVLYLHYINKSPCATNTRAFTTILT
nr:MAG TPA: hypothetical protein [Caudoviricetes sp.]DAN88704.1 MAG TPA: hypothetical protein [Caudoviricetes sp.]